MGGPSGGYGYGGYGDDEGVRSVRGRQDVREEDMRALESDNFDPDACELGHNIRPEAELKRV